MISILIASVTLQQLIQQPGSFVRTIERTDGVAVSQTAAFKLTADGKPDVWLVGTAHIGLKKYYADVQALLDAQDVVLFEGVRSKNRPMTPPKADPKAPKPIYEVLSDAIGLDFQLVDINYDRPHWINSDLSMEQLDALNKKGGHGKPTQFDMVEKMLDPKSSQTQMMGQFFKSAPASVKNALKIFLIEKLAKVDTLLPGMTDPTTLNVLLTARNRSVEDVFDKVIKKSQPPHSVAIYYGAAHMPGIEKAFAGKYGYKPVEQRWLTFAKADRHKLDDAGRQFLDILEKSSQGFGN
jgi:hypothetical protein